MGPLLFLWLSLACMMLFDVEYRSGWPLALFIGMGVILLVHVAIRLSKRQSLL